MAVSRREDEKIEIMFAPSGGTLRPLCHPGETRLAKQAHAIERFCGDGDSVFCRALSREFSVPPMTPL
jgi:hypothetical protein